MAGEFPGSYVILLVDDEEMVRNIGTRLLEKLGYTVYAVPGGSEAVAFCRRAEPVPDCLVIDLNMPLMDGEETLAAIRSIVPDISAVLATGYSAEVVGYDETSSAWSAMLQKPFRLDAVAAVMNSVRAKQA